MAFSFSLLAVAFHFSRAMGTVRDFVFPAFSLKYFVERTLWVCESRAAGTHNSVGRCVSPREQPRNTPLPG